jgi:AcrR family transcriptional regulator
MRSNNKRKDIVEAALRVVEEQGANHLTIDAVAAAAGFSKGGVLYHFATKKALLSGMLEHMIDANSERIDSPSEKQRSTISQWVRGRDKMTAAERRASLALLAAVAEDPELLQPAKVHMKEVIHNLVTESETPTEALMLFLATEGLRFLDILELNPLTAKQTAEVTRFMNSAAENL